MHAEALRVVEQGALLPAHAGLESYSVLTRLPEPTRASPERVGEFLHEAFGDAWLVPSGATLGALVDELARHDIRGGATYDALIAATARDAGATLITCDRRAQATYERLGVKVTFLG